MKLAEFFVVLGFDIQGAPELRKLESELNELTSQAAKLLAVFGSVTAGMTVMLNRSLDAADALRKFSAVTGLPVQELKGWELAMSRAGGEAADLVATIKALQQARTDIMMGTGNVAPWQLLGITPSQNPFDTLRKLKDRIKEMDPTIARSIVGQMGVSEDVFAMLRLSNREFDELEKKYVITKQQQGNLTNVSRAWAEFSFLLGSVRDKIVAELVPALIPLIKGLQKMVSLIANFAGWLAKNSAAAKATKVILIGLAGGIVLVTVALGALVSALGLATAYTVALQMAMSPLIPVIWGVIGAGLIIATTLAAFVLVVQDLWVAIEGGDSVLAKLSDRFQTIKVLVLSILGPLIQLMRIMQTWDKIEKIRSAGKAEGGEAPESKSSAFLRSMFSTPEFLKVDIAKMLQDASLQPQTAASRSTSIRQENNIDINVSSGGNDPYQTGRAVADPLKQALSDAAYQIPVPTT